MHRFVKPEKNNDKPDITILLNLNAPLRFNKRDFNTFFKSSATQCEREVWRRGGEGGVQRESVRELSLWQMSRILQDTASTPRLSQESPLPNHPSMATSITQGMMVADSVHPTAMIVTQ